MRELLFSLTKDDFEWDTFRVGGAGGQRRDKRNTGVRCRHLPSGAVGESREDRLQGRNKRQAFRRCCESQAFQTWVQSQAAGTRSLEEVVDEMMAEENLRVEYYTP